MASSLSLLLMPGVIFTSLHAKYFTAVKITVVVLCNAIECGECRVGKQSSAVLEFRIVVDKMTLYRGRASGHICSGHVSS